MDKVKESVKQTLVGQVHERDYSTSLRSQFEKYASHTEEDGERYMTEGDFVEAIAPENEDYVSARRRCQTTKPSVLMRRLSIKYSVGNTQSCSM